MIGQDIAHYKIIGKLGEGGMGAVYRAEDTKLRRQVALKFLPPELAADPSARRRMLKEAQVASRLNHSNIATIYEVRDTGDMPFIAMELVEGDSLKDILERGAMPTNRMLDVARQMADGLEEAHAAGVLHRDLKPANVMVDAKGRVKVLDFGLAVVTGRERAPDEAPDAFMTRSRTQWSTGGTVPYMPPEQLRGETTDVRGDIFSFGVLLYECLSGRYPFPGTNAVDMMAAIVSKPPIPLHEVTPDIDPQWERNIERCLAKHPDERFQTVRELREAFRSTQAAPKKVEKSVAVLFFENLSRDAEDEYFRDGITEDIITELSNIKDLRVYPRSTMLPYRDKPVTVSQVAQQLNARYVLEGTLRRGGNRIRLTAQLVETRSGHALWAERFDRQMEDVFAIQDEIAQSIARTLSVMLSPKERRAIEKKPTQNVQAYDYYLQGRQSFREFRQKGFDYARQLFARATILDPRFARAYAGVADCCSLLYSFWEGKEANVKEAEAASQRALELDPELAEAYVARGLAVSLSQKYEEAARAYKRAIELDPNLYDAYYFFARACLSQGDLEKAGDLFGQASAVRPEDYQAPAMLGMILDGLGRTEEADMVYRRGLDAADRHLALHSDDARALYLGSNALCRLGEQARAVDWARRALEKDPDEPLAQYNVACTYTKLRMFDEAIECLENALRGGSRDWHMGWIKHDSDLDALRELPRFQALLEGLE